MAEKLLTHADDRTPLIEGIHEIASRVPGLTYLQDKFPDGTSGPLRDICPFTTMGTFNRSMTDANRKTIAGELAKLLGVTVPVPPSFEGIPVLNNQRSWFSPMPTSVVRATSTRYGRYSLPRARWSMATSWTLAMPSSGLMTRQPAWVSHGTFRQVSTGRIRGNS